MWKIQLSSLLLLSTALLSLSGCGYFDLCGNRVEKEILSPNGKKKAVVFERDCGATTKYSTQVSILNAEAKLPNETGNVFASYGKVDHIFWEGDSQLVIKHDKDDRVFVNQSNIFDVNIRYSFYCENSIYLAVPSPDGKKKAVVFFGDCGEKETSRGFLVTVLPAEVKLPEKPNIVFAAETTMLPVWQGNQKLEIEYYDYTDYYQKQKEYINQSKNKSYDNLSQNQETFGKISIIKHNISDITISYTPYKSMTKEMKDLTSKVPITITYPEGK